MVKADVIQMDTDGDFYTARSGYVFVRYRTREALYALRDEAEKSGAVQLPDSEFSDARACVGYFPKGSTTNYVAVFHKKEIPFDTPETCLLWILLAIGSEG